jgi:GT2 family glycosyltransferase
MECVLLSRPDATDELPKTALSDRSYGFSTSLALPPGLSLLTIEAESATGTEMILARRLVINFTDSLRGLFQGDRKYSEWIERYDTASPLVLARWRESSRQLAKRPLFSFVLQGPATGEGTRQSIREQLYERWEILEETQTVAEAQGEYIIILGTEVRLRPQALYFWAQAINQRPAANLLYSDSDEMDQNGRRKHPHFRSAWNPDLLLTHHYLGSAVVYATALIRPGGMKSPWDLALRATEGLPRDQVVHLPHLLYHEISAKPIPVLEENEWFLTEAVKRRGLDAQVERVGGDYFHVRRRRPFPAPAVTLIIPTRNQFHLLRQAVESILARTSYPAFEILLVDNNSDEVRTVQYMADLVQKNPRVRLLSYPGAFNYSAINNAAVQVVHTPLLGLLNNDVEVLDGNWLEEMVVQAVRPEVGGVGAKLLFPHGSVQHAGVVLGSGGVAGHAGYHQACDDFGYDGRSSVVANVSAVTGACLVLRRELYEQMGGFDEKNLPINYNDVDLLLRLREAGYWNVFTPRAQLRHYESASRGGITDLGRIWQGWRERRWMQRRWGGSLQADPFYNPNLSLDGELFRLAFPPRVPPPEQRAGR